MGQNWKNQDKRSRKERIEETEIELGLVARGHSGFC